MGLDMYLYKRTSDVTKQVAYWRKANAIHAWFVEHCQNGVDECQTTPVDAERLVVLRDLCQRLLDTHAADPVQANAMAAEQLPPQAGFFFGSTELDDWYWQDVRETAEVLTAILAEPRDAYAMEYLYRASW